MKKIKRFIKFIVLFLIPFVISSCAREQITITGSETMYPMLKKLAEDYNSINRKVEVIVRGGGSKVGLMKLVKNETHFAATSMDISQEIMMQLAYIDTYEMVVIAYDGIAIVVNPNNPVSKLNLSQVSDIFAGKIKNWKEVGGYDHPINVIIRNDESGTALFMKEYGLRKKLLGDFVYEKNKHLEYTKTAIVAKNNRQIAELLQQNLGAISYMGMGSAETEGAGKVRTLNFAIKETGPYYPPMVVTVEKRQYELSRPLMLFYRPDKGIKDEFVEYLKTERAKNIILSTGYYDSVYSKVMMKTLRVKGKK